MCKVFTIIKTIQFVRNIASFSITCPHWFMAQKYELYCAILIHGNAFMRTLIVAVSGLLRICEHFKGFSTYQVEMIIFV